MTTTMMGAPVIYQGLFLSSLAYTIPYRRKYFYKVMEKLIKRVTTTPYTNNPQDNKYNDEKNQDNGGRDW